MNLTKITSLVKYVIGGLGAALVGFGFADNDTVSQVVSSWETLVGAAGVIIAAITGIVAKIKAGKQ